MSDRNTLNPRHVEYVEDRNRREELDKRIRERENDLEFIKGVITGLLIAMVILSIMSWL